MGELAAKTHDMGDQNTAQERKIEKPDEFVIYVLREFRNFHVLIGVGVVEFCRIGLNNR